MCNRIFIRISTLLALACSVYACESTSNVGLDGKDAGGDTATFSADSSSADSNPRDGSGGGGDVDPVDSAMDVATDSVQVASGLSIEVVSGFATHAVGNSAGLALPQYFAVFDVVVTNRTGSSISAGHANFRSLASSGTENVVYGYTHGIDGGCKRNAFIAHDGQLRCTLAFEVTEPPLAIRIVTKREGSDRTLSARSDVTSFRGCAACGESYCVDTMTDMRNCGACGRSAADCLDGEPQCQPIGVEPYQAWCENENSCQDVGFVSPARCGGTMLVSKDRKKTCAELCANGGQTCADRGYYPYATFYLKNPLLPDVPMDQSLRCDETPPNDSADPIIGDMTYDSTTCWCE